jgi:hypothetical protein
MNDDFIQKLMIAKKVMDKHNEIPRGGSSSTPNMDLSTRQVSVPEPYFPESIPSTYNIPNEYLQEQKVLPKKPVEITEDRIKNSKLPDAIKELMIKHPIKQPEQYNPTLSDDVIEKAARLMNNGNTITQTSNKQTSKPTNQNNSDIRKIVREELENILSENGLLSESESKSNEVFQFRVGKHIFEGRVTKIKQVK